MGKKPLGKDYWRGLGMAVTFLACRGFLADRSDATGNMQWGWFAGRIIICTTVLAICFAKIPWFRR